MTEAELQAIEARCVAASPGPWRRGEENESKVQVEDATGRRLFTLTEAIPFHPRQEPNRQFVIAARFDAAALVAEVRRLQGIIRAAHGGDPDALYEEAERLAACPTSPG